MSNESIVLTCQALGDCYDKCELVKKITDYVVENKLGLTVKCVSAYNDDRVWIGCP